MRLLARTFYRLQGIIERLSRQLTWVAAGALISMVLLLCANIGIRLFYEPILGVYEVVGLMAAILVSFAVAYTQVLKGHIEIPVVVSLLPQRAQAVIASAGYLVSLGVVSLITWQSFLQANLVRDKSEISGVLPIPIFPVVYGLAFCFALFGLVLLIDLFRSLAEVVKK